MGLLRKIMMTNIDDTKIVKSAWSGFSCAKLEAGRNELGLCMARLECSNLERGVAKRILQLPKW